VAWDVKERVIWIVGLARSGCAAGRMLRDAGAHVIGVDDAEEEVVRRRWDREGLTNMAPRAFDEILTGGGWPKDPPGLVVISPGVRTDHPALAGLPATVEVIGELEAAARFCRAELVAVTGTNGKSTVTEWVAHLGRKAGRRAEAVGNVGRPLSLMATELEPADLAVVEVSSFQLETVDTFRPRVGVVLNLAPDHLDRYEDLDAYYAAKRVLAEKIEPGGRFVTWTGCPEAMGWPSPAPRLLFGEGALGAEVRWNRERLEADFGPGAGTVIARQELALASPPNLINALATTAVGVALGLPRDAVAAGLRDFRGLAHRHQLVGRRGGIRFVNDTKATNVHAVCAGLAGWRGAVVLIAGGSGKGEDYTPLRSVMGAVRHLVTIGSEGPAIGATVDDLVPVTAAGDMADAVARAADLAEPDATVLLSPACASFDMFSGYRERGEAFAAAALQAGAVSSGIESPAGDGGAP